MLDKRIGGKLIIQKAFNNISLVKNKILFGFLNTF